MMSFRRADPRSCERSPLQDVPRDGGSSYSAAYSPTFENQTACILRLRERREVSGAALGARTSRMVRVTLKIVVSFAFHIGQSERPIVRFQLAWSPGSR